MTRRKLFTTITGALASLVTAPKKALGFCWAQSAANSSYYLGRVIVLNSAEAILPIELKAGDKLALGHTAFFLYETQFSRADVELYLPHGIRWIHDVVLPCHDIGPWSFYVVPRDITLIGWGVQVPWGLLSKTARVSVTVEHS